ncbi:NAD-dependent epimerase/dehydratase family protein [Ramlibacter sp. Leaf400]|uniref:NAD-dependent epimerase/dehydratase family protein n=1 Tax=Ramlibacter sp. Leaf400 TaxID=1736365 RepID=UPI000701045A|nr:NAD-dependent epimerase/dehydratase family protein [Ramlibacter sp. Leaf400]KQT13550.1 epimerase [Ramlibacter sp. Leaf400]
MTGRVLVLGGSGYIGSRLVRLLREAGYKALSASSRAQPGEDRVRLDTRDGAALAQALQGMDAVVNCVAGDAGAIAEGAATLVHSAATAGCPRIVHLSTMSVYGAVEGRVDEHTAPGPLLGWYDQAKREADKQIAQFATGGGRAVLLRPGCVWGPGSELWVGRVGRWLRAGRLGDLGAAGDGWSNLVHVDDVCIAAIRSLELSLAPGEQRTFNLAAPDSPRWNEYFSDLALALGATPVRRLSARRLQLEGKVAGPALHLLRKAGQRMGRDVAHWPEPVTPGLVALWRRHLHLDARAAARELRLDWTPYPAALQEAAAWFLEQESLARVGARAVASPG